MLQFFLSAQNCAIINFEVEESEEAEKIKQEVMAANSPLTAPISIGAKRFRLVKNAVRLMNLAKRFGGGPKDNSRAIREAELAGAFKQAKIEMKAGREVLSYKEQQQKALKEQEQKVFFPLAVVNRFSASRPTFPSTHLLFFVYSAGQALCLPRISGYHCGSHVDHNPYDSEYDSWYYQADENAGETAPAKKGALFFGVSEVISKME